MKRLAWRGLAVLLSPAIGFAADSPARLEIPLGTITSSTETNVTTNVGLGGALSGQPPPASWKALQNSSMCMRQRHASFVSNEEVVSEIVTINGHDYLDVSIVDFRDGPVKVSAHTRRPVTRVATVADGGVWAYREGGTLFIGTFADFEDTMCQFAFSHGCRWATFGIRERGGSGVLFSDGGSPSLSIAASISRSSADGAPNVVIRPRTL